MLNSNLYNEVELQTNVMSATPQQLIQLLLIKCCTHLNTAREQMAKGQVGSKWATMQKALDIVTYLRICLNFKDGQCAEMSKELDRLYVYIQKQIIAANTKNKMEPIDEVVRLLMTMQEGWACVSTSKDNG
jgi:flagellar secretion chaperone FliS